MSENGFRVFVWLCFAGFMIILLLAGQNDGPVVPVDVPDTVEVSE